MQVKEKVRIYLLARELNMESKDLLDLCRQTGFDVKNQLSSLDPEQVDAVKELVKRGPATASHEQRPSGGTMLPPTKPVPVLSSRPRTLDTRAPRREPESKPAAPAPPTPPAAPPAPTPTAPAAKALPAVTPTIPAEPPAPKAPAVPPAAPKAPLAPAAKAPEQVPPAAPRPPEPPPPPEAPPRPPEVGGRVPTVAAGKPPDLAGRPRTDAPTRVRRIPGSMRPVIVSRAAPIPSLKKPVTEEKKVQQPTAQKPLMRLPTDVAKTGGPVNVTDLMRQQKGLVPAPGTVETEEDEEAGRDRKGGAKGGTAVRPGGVAGREKRHQERNARAQERRSRIEATVGAGGKVVEVDELDRPQRSLKSLRKGQQKHRGPTAPRKGKVPISLPISARSLSEALGVPSVALLFKLKDLGMAAANLNVSITREVAENLALEQGIELDIKRAPDAEEELLASLNKEDNPEDLLPRAPVVTIMGHVDHGKTSLLDKIRESNIVATEAGGITQVIRAWRVDHNGKPITFLDTPGHEAFTKMRARGANVTDIAVIVVAADDGVMPQTQEAINHARAAGVWIVVAINKVDLPSANVTKTRQQLYSLNLLPDNMGGDVPFVETSAATGKGIDELLDNISIVAELKELKANPNKPASGTCLEAMLNEGEGVFATLLIQDGTLRKGDTVLVGAAHGRVRALYDDLGRPIQEAGPSVPVRITGLDEVPNADDSFQVVPDLATAREIAAKRQQKQQEASMVKREPGGLERLSAAKIAELKVILKADFRGSIEAIRKELEKLHHEEVRVRLLHAGIGAITESDVQLALTSPEDTIIVGFNAVPDDRAQQQAEERGVQIREYNIIYNLTDDIRSALEGKLKPREEVVHLGRAVVRETFKISRVGTVAGCFVTQGTIERNAKVRVIREGLVIYPPPDKTAGLESLRRVKEDVREVRAGLECGIKLAGYDDIKVGDVIEAYRVEQIQRTLEK